MDSQFFNTLEKLADKIGVTTKQIITVYSQHVLVGAWLELIVLFIILLFMIKLMYFIKSEEDENLRLYAAVGIAIGLLLFLIISPTAIPDAICPQATAIKQLLESLR